MMVLWFTSGKLSSLVFIALYGAGLYLGMDPKLCPVSVLWYGQAINIPMIIVGKFMQVIIFIICMTSDLFLEIFNNNLHNQILSVVNSQRLFWSQKLV